MGPYSLKWTLEEQFKKTNKKNLIVIFIFQVADS